MTIWFCSTCDYQRHFFVFAWWE